MDEDKNKIEKLSFHDPKVKVCVIITACFTLGFFIWVNSFDSIKNIVGNMNFYKEKVVHLKGNALSSFSLPFTGSLYKLSDRSGSIWVVSKIDTVEKNDTIFVSGKVKTKLDMKSGLDEKLRQFNLKIDNIGPVLVEIEREDIWTTFKNMFKEN